MEEALEAPPAHLVAFAELATELVGRAVTACTPRNTATTMAKKVKVELMQSAHQPDTLLFKGEYAFRCCFIYNVTLQQYYYFSLTLFPQSQSAMKVWAFLRDKQLCNVYFILYVELYQTLLSVVAPARCSFEQLVRFLFLVIFLYVRAYYYKYILRFY